MSDKLVFDLAQEVEGSPSVFVRKDWLNILDNQNQNYNNNQSIIDTSQLSNSNKYMSYREAYLSIPFLISFGNISQTQTAANTLASLTPFAPNQSGTSADYSVGLKNWFGQIIHSFTLDYNGTTIIQQTPYINMWNSFKLMTSLSLDDINTQGATIGFYPDDALSWQFVAASTTPVAAGPGQGVCNNTNFIAGTVVTGAFNNFSSGKGNEGFLRRQQLINFDISGIIGTGSTYGTLITGSEPGSIVGNLWKSFISRKIDQTGLTNATGGLIQYTVVATVYLKHIHSFFNMCPLLKGVFMKMTMNLNNTSTTFIAVSTTTDANPGVTTATGFTCTGVSNPLGGVNPLMFASAAASNGSATLGLYATGGGATGVTAATINTRTFKMNISVGATCLDTNLNTVNNGGGLASKSVYLYIPAYTFNPVFEQAYLSSPVKQIKYTDVYQYQVLNIQQNAPFNNLLTNGIANIKSVLVLPFYSSTVSATPVSLLGTQLSPNTGFISGTPVWQSPYDPAGTGPTSPLCWLTNFNIQVSGQNAIYNTQRYNFEQFNNQLYGQNAVNGGLTDGITSGLIDRQSFDMCYSYYYVNVERMLPVEMSVPKSIQILGQNLSSRSIDLYCFIEYGVEVSIDALTGARV
jgi:hypothetical protein